MDTAKLKRLKLTENQLNLLQELQKTYPKWVRLEKVGGEDSSNHSKIVVSLIKKQLAERKQKGGGEFRIHYLYRITQLGLDYLNFTKVTIEEKENKKVTEEDFPYIQLVPNDISTLISLADGLHNWCRPMMIGGFNGSHHSLYLKRLTQKGLIDQSVWGNNVRPSYRYRINSVGIQYLKWLKENQS